MKSNLYRENNNIERLCNNKNTFFLDNKEFRNIKHKLKGINYKVYYLYEECDKVILYKDVSPNVVLIKIICDHDLKHQSILGTLFSLGIDICYCGDIIKYKGNFYMFILEDIKYYITNNLKNIDNYIVKLEEVPISFIEGYKRDYQELEFIVSSTRLDVVISSICNISRKMAEMKIIEKDIILNYDVATKSTYILKENDIFSIRKFGKFKFVGVIKTTKKDKLIVRVLKYI